MTEMNGKQRKVVIFCSASDKIDPKYNVAARELVRGLCSKGYTIVSGGTVKGTMGVVSDEVAKVGGRHIGVLPRFMASVEHPSLSEVLYTGTMSERKALMREGAVAAIALPGGIGTLDELVETHVLSKLGIFHGKIFALDVDGFYDPLRALLDHYTETQMLEKVDREMILFPSSVEQLLREL